MRLYQGERHQKSPTFKLQYCFTAPRWSRVDNHSRNIRQAKIRPVLTASLFRRVVWDWGSWRIRAEMGGLGVGEEGGTVGGLSLLALIHSSWCDIYELLSSLFADQRGPAQLVVVLWDSTRLCLPGTINWTWNKNLESIKTTVTPHYIKIIGILEPFSQDRDWRMLGVRNSWIFVCFS